MAQKTELSATGVPGRVHSFVAKAAFVIMPGMQFTTQRERLEFTVEEIPEFAEETALHFTTED